MKIMEMMVLVVGISCMSCSPDRLNPKSVSISSYIDDVKTYDPSDIKHIEHYVVLDNLHRKLVTIDNDGVLIGDLAESNYWDGNTLVFKIHDNLYTSKGRKIDSLDVLYTFKRILIKNSNNHANLRSFLGDIKIKSITDEIEELKASGNKIFFKAKEKNTLLLRALTSADFVILPRDSFDHTTLEINDYSNTTGLYYLKFYEYKKVMQFLKNEYIKEDVVKEIWLVHNRTENGTPTSFELIQKGKVDIIPAYDSPLDEEVATLRSDKNINTFETLPYNLLYGIFTNEALRKFSADDRNCITKFLQEKTDVLVSDKNKIPTTQFFPINSEGYLIDRKNSSREVLNCSLKYDNLNFAAIAGTYRRNKKLIDSFGGKINPNADFDFSNDRPGVDVFISEVDSAYHEDVSLVGMFSSMKLFGYKESEKVFETYVKIGDKEERLSFLKKMHKNSLDNSYVIPLYFSPYIAFYRSGIKIDQSRHQLNFKFSYISSED